MAAVLESGFGFGFHEDEAAGDLRLTFIQLGNLRLEATAA
jgi:hypothetical protein